MPKLTKKAPKKAKDARMKSEMGKFKAGELHSGSKSGPKVTSRAQAVAIGLSESGQSKKHTKPTEAHTKTAEKVKHHEALASKHRAHADLGRAKLRVQGKRLNYDGKIVDDDGGY